MLQSTLGDDSLSQLRDIVIRSDVLYSNSIKTLKCFYWPDAFASGASHTMRGDLQCNTIFFQPKGWKTAVRLHRSHKTIFNRFMEDQYKMSDLRHEKEPFQNLPMSMAAKKPLCTAPETLPVFLQSPAALMRMPRAAREV